MSDKLFNPKHPPWKVVIKEYTPEQMAKVMGSLPYDELANFLDLLSKKIAEDGVKDGEAGKPNLAKCLRSVSESLKMAEFSTKAAWGICRPHMVKKEPETRYMVRATSTDFLDMARMFLNEANVTIFVDSEKRNYLSTGKIPGDLTLKLDMLGIKVTKDEQYDLEVKQ